jgi:hypothetical protein
VLTPTDLHTRGTTCNGDADTIEIATEELIGVQAILPAAMHIRALGGIEKVSPAALTSTACLPWDTLGDVYGIIVVV